MRLSSDAFSRLRRSMFKCLQLSVLYPEGRNPEYGPIYVPLTRYGYFRFDNTASFCLEYTNRPLTLLYVCIVARKNVVLQVEGHFSKKFIGYYSLLLLRLDSFFRAQPTASFLARDGRRCSDDAIPVPSWQCRLL